MRSGVMMRLRMVVGICVLGLAVGGAALGQVGAGVEEKEVAAWPEGAKVVGVSGDWRHLAYVVDGGGKQTLYLDGTEVGKYEAIAFQPYQQVSPKMVPVGPPGEGSNPMDGERPALSVDGKRLAFVVKQANKWAVVVDGKTGPSVERVTRLAFTGDGKHVVYVATVGENKEVVVVDGKAGPVLSYHHPVITSSDFKRIGYVGGIFGEMVGNARRGEGFVYCDGQFGPRYDGGASGLVFSPDSKRMAYVAGRGMPNGRTYSIVVDGRVGGPGSLGAEIRFSPDGRRIGYKLEKAERQGKDGIIQSEAMVIDGKEGPVLDGLSSVVFSPDSKHYAYVGKRGLQGVVVLDGKEFPGPATQRCTIVFSPDSKRVAYWCEARRQGESAGAWLDGKGLDYESVTEIVFSQDSKHVAFGAMKRDQGVVVMDGKEIPTGMDRKTLPVISPDGLRLAYATAGGGRGKKGCVVMDGQEGPMFDQIHGLSFSGDGKRWMYWGVNGKRWHLVVDGVERGVYEAPAGMEAPKVKFGADGSLVFAGVRDGKLWQVRVGG